MKPLSLSLRNVRTYESLDLDLPVGACAWIGENGAGKTSIMAAIDAALFGPDSRTFADWLSEESPEGTMSITLTFEHERETYRARRTYSGKGRGQSKFDLERQTSHFADDERGEIWNYEPLTVESQKSTQQVLEDLIGLTRETFRASSFIAAGAMFCDLPPREQKRILGELLQLGQWDGWKDTAALKRRATESELDRLAGSLERAEAELAERPQIEAERAAAQERESEAKTALDSAVSQLASARERLAQARSEGERRAGAEKAVQDAEAMVSTLKAQIEGRETAVAQYDGRLAEREGLETLVEGLPGLERERDSLAAQKQGWAERGTLLAEHERLSAEARIARQNALDLEDRALRVLADTGEPCDRCGQALHAEAMQRAATSYRDEAQAFAFCAHNIENAELPDLNAKIGALPADAPDQERAARVHDLIQLGQNAQVKLAALDEVKQHREEANSELLKMRAELPEREQGLTATRAALTALGPHDPQAIMEVQFLFEKAERKEQAVHYEITQVERQLAVFQERLERLDTIVAEAKTARDRRDTLHADLDLYTKMEKACGQNGVPALILEQIAIPQLETAADEILRRFGCKAIGVQLLTQREKKDGGLADTLQVNVLTEHGSRNYSTFSTGERLRINAALTLAIAQLVAARSAHTGLLVIDDLGPLDAQGMAVLAEICQDLQETVGRVYVISQASELRDAFEHSITIESVDGKSRIVNGTTTEPIPTIESSIA
jgi:DNA repair protein SbcC/Rad50